MTTQTQERPKVIKRIERRKPNQVTVDLRVQRMLDQNRVDSMIVKWNDLAMGVPTLSQREGGQTIALDGQTRLEALRQMGRGDESFDCTVYRNLTLEQEAEMFALLNNTKKLLPIDLFRVAVIAGDPEALACNDLVARHGYVAASGHKNSFMAVNALLRAWRRDPLSTERAIITAVGSWGPTRESADNRLFTGLASLYFRYGDMINLAQLIERLRKGVQTDAASLIGRARTNSKVRSISVPDAVADIVVNIYNGQRKTNRLPNWE